MGHIEQYSSHFPPLILYRPAHYDLRALSLQTERGIIIKVESLSVKYGGWGNGEKVWKLEVPVPALPFPLFPLAHTKKAFHRFMSDLQNLSLFYGDDVGCAGLPSK